MSPSGSPLPPDLPADLPADFPADQRRRARMVRDQLGDCADARVRTAMAACPRHVFVPAELSLNAYDDAPLPIGAGQTISQPRVVARMLTALALAPGQRVLDVGCGSGYAAALIAMLVAPGGSVHACERQAALIAPARARLTALGLANVELRHADALAADSGTYHAIHVAAACPDIPPALIAALARSGRMVLPVGAPNAPQRLLLIRKDEHGALTTEALDDVLFVPALPGLGADPG